MKIRAGGGKKPSDGASADLSALRSQLESLDANVPAEVIVPHLFYENVTPEALGKELAKGWPSASLWSEEAGLVIGSHGMNDESIMRYLSLLNRLWDGVSSDNFRVTKASYLIEGHRLTVSLMMRSCSPGSWLPAAASRGASAFSPAS